jgi:hypothetical protein
MRNVRECNPYQNVSNIDFFIRSTPVIAVSSGKDAQTGHPTRPQQFLTRSQKGGLVDPRLRGSNDINNPSKLVRCLFRDGG